MAGKIRSAKSLKRSQKKRQATQGLMAVARRSLQTSRPLEPEMRAKANVALINRLKTGTVNSRAKAVELLAGLNPGLKNAAVKKALEKAAKTDVNVRVRRDASQALKKKTIL